MNVPLQKWYKRIIPLLLIFCLLCHQLMATPDCPIVSGNFSGLPEGTTVNNSSTGWYLNATNVSSSAIFWVKSNRLHAQELGGEGVWYSKIFSVAGYTDFQIATKITAEGDMNSTEYVKVYYKINGGAEILLDQRTGNFGTVDFVSPLLNGSNVQFVIRIYNYNNGGSQTSKYYIEDYRVFKEHGSCAGSVPVSVSAGNNGVLTCSNSSLVLSASSTASGVTYSWTGPGFTSTAQNPVITVAGTYHVVATNSTGSGSASITITENKASPGITAAGASLGCASSVTIHAASPVANAQYAWSGPGFSSTLQNPVVTTAGTYTVTVTNPANGCTSSQQVQVTGGNMAATVFWLEDFTLANGTVTDAGATAWSLENIAAGAFSVQNNELIASFNAANEGVWRSGVINIASKSNVRFSLNLRSGTAGSSDFFEDDDYIKVYYKLDGGAETLLFSDINGLKGTTTGTAYDTVNSPVLNGSSLQIIVRLRNSSSTERYYLDNVKLTGYNTGTAPLSASVTGVATCTATAQLNATATGTVASWSWTGPDNFTSTLQNPSVGAGGQYIVTANFTDGCAASVPVTVTENKTVPDVTASGGSLACFASININAGSSLSAAQYSWSGPNNFASTLKSPSVTAAGTYTVTVTNPANGCTAVQSVQVTPAYGVAYNLWQEAFPVNGINADNDATAWSIQAPANAVAAVNGNQFRVSNTGTTGEVVWTSGSIDIAGKSNVTISGGARSSITGSAVMNETGEYADYIQFYYQLNNGTPVMFAEKRGIINSHSTTLTSLSAGSLSGTSLRIIIRARATGNDEFYYFDNVLVTGIDQGGVNASASVSDTLTCNRGLVTISGNSTTPDVTYSWTGPDNFIAGTQNATATAPGVYTLTVSNGTCSSTASVTVVQKNTPPANVAITPSGTNTTLTCNVNNVVVFASSSTPGVTYSWTGPNNYSSSSNGITAFNAGVYTVTVTNPVNGCTANASYTVLENRVFPGANVSPNLAILNCYTPGKLITGSATATTVKYSWTRPNGTTDTGAVIQATAPGNYYLLVTDTVNGCTTSTTAVMTEDRAIPATPIISAPANAGMITCVNSSVELTGSSSSTGLNYSWTGPNGFIASTPVIHATVQGIYNLTVSYPGNGCAASTTVTVAENTASPAGVSAFSSDQLTCFIPVVRINGSSTTPGATYSWTGPNGFTATGASAQVAVGGTYQFKATNPANGCTETIPVNVAQNITAPDITVANSGPLTCSVFEATITGSSTAPNVDYSWSGPDGFLSSLPEELVFTPGDYVLTVLDLNNGCTAMDTTTVVQDLTECQRSRTSEAKTTSLQPETAAVQPGKPGPFVYKAYPNPFGDRVYVEFKAPVTAPVHISIYNPTGICKKVLFNSTAQAGQLYKLPFDAAMLPVGVYYCVIRIDKKTYTIKMLSLKN